MSPARRFEARETTTYRDLQAVMRKMGATSLAVRQDFKTNEYEIAFDRSGRRYVFRCRKWPNAADNLRATQRTISLLYQAMEEYGTQRQIRDAATGQTAGADTFAQFFLPFEATPDDSVLLLGSGTRKWWEILGVSERATKAEITSAYRALARVHHPDMGGNAEDFQRLRHAYEDGLRAVAA